MRAAVRERHHRPVARGQSVILLPGLIVLAAFFLAPLASMLGMSVRQYTGPGSISSALTLGNYLRFAVDPYYRGVLVRTLILGLETTVICAILGYPLAHRIARSSKSTAGLLTVLVLAPLMTSVVVRAFGWMLLLGKFGAIDSFLAALGLPRPDLMYSFQATVVALAQVLLPFMVLSLSASIQQIRPELEDSVRSLGGSPWRIFADVLLPLSLPGLMAGSALVFSLSISAFATPFLIGGARTQVVATMIYQQAITVLNWPVASAGSFVLVAIAVALVTMQIRLLRWRARWLQ